MLEINKIYFEDCLEGMKRIDDKSVDMILADLPYGTTANKWDEVISFDLLWKQYNRIIQDNAIIALFGSQPFTTAIINSNPTMFKYCWYWKKTKAIGFQHSKNKPMKIVEEICIFSRCPMGHISQLGNKRMRYNPQDVVPVKEKTVLKSWHGNMMGARPNQVGKKYMAYTNFPNDLLDFSQPVGNKTLHSTQKPVELCEYLIKTYTDERMLVLDNVIGSGTTAIACINTHRNYIGFENNEKYYNIANERIEKHLESLKCQ